MESKPDLYRIVVEGHLSLDWVDWPGVVEAHQALDNAQGPITCLTVAVPDQPALHGALQTIRDLNLTMISLQRLGSMPGEPV